MNEKFTDGEWLPNLSTGDITVLETEDYVAEVFQSRRYEEYEANLQLISHAKDLYYALFKARAFVYPEMRTEIENLLREINPNFDKRPEVTDIKGFAERVKNMRDWQEEHAKTHSEDSQRYVDAQQDLVDSIVSDILQEAQS